MIPEPEIGVCGLVELASAHECTGELHPTHHARRLLRSLQAELGERGLATKQPIEPREQLSGLL